MRGVCWPECVARKHFLATILAFWGLLLRKRCSSVLVGLRALRLPEFHFVRRWAVHPGDFDVVQPQVDAELGAMMNEMAHDHAAQDGGARHGENLFSSVRQR